MLESIIEAKCRKIAQGLGGQLLKTKPTIVGWPDRLCIIPRPKRRDRPNPPPVIVFMEFKLPGEEPTPIQNERLSELIAMRCNVAVIHSVNEFNNVIAELA